MDDNNNINIEETEQGSEKEERSFRLIRLRNAVAFGLVCCFAFGLVLFILTSEGYIRLGRESSGVTDAPASAVDERFSEVYDLLEKQYVGDLDEESQLTEALKAYVKALGDPYTEYLEMSEAEEFIDGSYGQKYGIGVRVFESTDPPGIYVKYAYPGAPAEKAGILSGDVIVSVDGVSVTHENYEKSVDAVAGEEGTTVKLSVKRGEETKEFSVVRGSFNASPIEYRLLNCEGDIAYLRIDGVSSNSSAEFKAALEALKALGAKAYVFDVRDDGGGYLDEVTSMLDLLLPEGPIVHYTHKGEEDERVVMSDADVLIDAPMAVLINKNTASAAELFAAALRDYKLAVLVGKTTYGKGVIQTLYELKNGDVLKITTGRYDPPYGENYQGVGVNPDVEVSLPSGESFYLLKESEDTQLQAAISELQNKLQGKQ